VLLTEIDEVSGFIGYQVSRRSSRSRAAADRRVCIFDQCIADAFGYQIVKPAFFCQTVSMNGYPAVCLERHVVASGLRHMKCDAMEKQA
jgi:hypothetical protein